MYQPRQPLAPSRARIHRILLPGSRACPFACAYCFAKTTTYRDGQLLSDPQAIPALDGMIIYPSCDSEFLFDPVAARRLRKILAGSPGACYVSFSTKATLTPRLLEKVAILDEYTRNRGGFVKVSVSMATKSQTEFIEPRTAPYENRLRSLELLRGGSTIRAAIEEFHSIARALSIEVKPIDHAYVLFRPDRVPTCQYVTTAYVRPIFRSQ